MYIYYFIQDTGKPDVNAINCFFFFSRNGSTAKGDVNPFEEEEWEENDALVDNGEPGVPVKALYDYEGAENDELSFKQGNV